MTARARTDLPPDVYPDDPWALLEEAYAPRFLYLTETIFALSNGHLGIRATLDEGSPAHMHGTFVNGFHETWPIVHPETAYGLARVGQTIVNAPDATVMRVEIDDEVLDVGAATSFRRWLDFRTGVLERRSTWTTRSGVHVTMHTRRIVSLAHREAAAFWMRIETDRDARVQIESKLINRQDATAGDLDIDDPRRAARLPHRVLEPLATTVDATRVIQSWKTSNSGMGLITALDHRINGEVVLEHERDPDDFTFRFHVEATPTAPVELSKFAVYTASDDTPDMSLRSTAVDTLDRIAGLGFDGLVAAQVVELERFWEVGDVEVDAGPEIQRAIRWTLFQLNQASAALEGLSIPAKGLTGQAYDGHYFWDTEIYVLPFLIYTRPDRAAEILTFRHRLLPAARRRAGELAVAGALFPWRTINGEEASAYFLAGTAQYHIDADVVYGLRKYVEVSGDDELLWDIGVELATETARMWWDLGFYRGGRFHIHGVTGPDEYTALVDDNAYTNAMARMNMRFASQVVERMRVEAPERYAMLSARLSLDPDEPVAWRLAADAMYIPHDLELGITPQDDNFLSKEPWDFENTPPSKYPLLLHFHPLVIYRYQVLKQADVVLVDFLLGEEFSPDLKRNNFDYYDPITTGDSSLSACVQSIMAAELGKGDAAESHFQHALFMDLADLAGNTTDGVHMASAGGVWMALVHGFGGLRDHGGKITLNPSLPGSWNRMRFKVAIRGSRLTVDIRRDKVTIRAGSEPIELTVAGEDVVAVPERAIEIELPAPEISSMPDEP
jgi:alpha,alpha-trehalose phosphorylase